MNIANLCEQLHHYIAGHGIIPQAGRKLRLKCDAATKTELETALTNAGITHSFITDTEFEFDQSIIHNASIAVFADDRSYVNNAQVVSQHFDSLTIIILQHGTGFLFKEALEVFSAEKAIFWNALSYPQLIDILIGNKAFTSVHDIALRKIIIFCDESKGPFTIGYLKQDPRCGEFGNISALALTLQEEFARIEFVKYFKNFVTLLTKHVEEKDRMYHLVKSLDNIIALANRDLDIYLSEFSFAKIQTEFKEARVKYFENIEKNIDLVGKQIASFPLTFAASAFAGFQVKDRPLIIWAIVAAYALYTVLAFRIIGVAAYNTKNLEEDVKAEMGKIKGNYPEIYESFKTDYEKVDNKITKLKSLTSWLRGTLIGLIVLFVIFALYLNLSSPGEAKPTEVKLLKSGTTDSVVVRWGDSLIQKSKSVILLPGRNE